MRWSIAMFCFCDTGLLGWVIWSKPCGVETEKYEGCLHNMKRFKIPTLRRAKDKAAVDLLPYLLVNTVINLLAKPLPFDYPCPWEWLGPGGLPGLQHLWRVALRAAVGSTPIHSRLLFCMHVSTNQ